MLLTPKGIRRAIAAGCALIAPVWFYAAGARAEGMPEGFVYLRDVAPSIVQDMRYAGPDNFTGKPVPGYGAAECVLKRSAAEALARAQSKAQSLGYSLKVYDCYRPVRAVRAFVAWAGAPEDGRTKHYYPHLKKSQLVPGYIASLSQHSIGFTVDLTMFQPLCRQARPLPGKRIAPSPVPVTEASIWAHPSIVSTPRPTRLRR